MMRVDIPVARYPAAVVIDHRGEVIGCGKTVKEALRIAADLLDEIETVVEKEALPDEAAANLVKIRTVWVDLDTWDALGSGFEALCLAAHDQHPELIGKAVMDAR